MQNAKTESLNPEGSIHRQHTTADLDLGFGQMARHGATLLACFAGMLSIANLWLLPLTEGSLLAAGRGVVLLLLAIGYLSIQVGGLSYKGPGGFELIATFDEIGGLSPRAPITISGVKVGQVERIGLAPDLRARVVLDLDPSLELPIDTSAKIVTEGVLGNKFIALEPGAEEDILKPGEELDVTESAISLEGLIGKFVNNAGLDDEEE